MSHSELDLSPADRAQLAELGIAATEVERQLDLFRQPPPPAHLDRPCTPGDGVALLRADQRRDAATAYATAAAAGRVSKFTPASGAASRMFQALLATREIGCADRGVLAARAARNDSAARDTLECLEQLPRFAFRDAWAAALARRAALPAEVLSAHASSQPTAVLAALLDADGLDYAALAKGLLPFHLYPEGPRTAFEEQLIETAAIARAADGAARLHLTVSPEHERAFRDLLSRVAAPLERRLGVRFAVDFSTQKRATDTLAVDAENRPFRTADGRLLFRPGGHGALIENLNDLQADLLFIKNIDNVQPDHLRAPAIEWMQLLLGHVATLQADRDRHLVALGAAASPAARASALDFARAGLGLDVATDAAVATLVALLDRPLRVCGVVRNTGEPGGGPFWVRDADGRCSAQIVESAQIDLSNPDQRRAFASATHFNPVFLACAVRDAHGRAYDLRRFVDPRAVFISHKSKDGRELKALERPGLWNGAMAHWTTLFVEVPNATFTPVKTINDLLRPAHQPPA